MAGNNAGIRRNRLPEGMTATKTPVSLSPATKQAFKDAAAASGNMSLSLYLEQLRRELEKAGGALPVFSSQLDSAEVKNSAAA